MSGKQRCYIDSNIWLYAFIETDDAVKTTLARNLIQTGIPCHFGTALLLHLR